MASVTVRGAAGRVRDAIPALLKTLDDAQTEPSDDDVLRLRAILVLAGQRAGRIVERERNRPFVQEPLIEPDIGTTIPVGLGHYG